MGWTKRSILTIALTIAMSGAVLLVIAEDAQACTLCQAGGGCPLHGTAANGSNSDGVAAFQVDDRFNNFSGGVAIGSAGVQGDPITLTWSIVPDGTTITPTPSISGESSDPSSLISLLNTEFGTSATWMPLIASSFDRWSELSGITFVFESNDDGQPIGSGSHPGVVGTRGDFRLSGHRIDTSGKILAYNYFPNTADMVIDTADGAFIDGTTNNFRAFRNLLMHEIGHGLGFGHVESSNANFLLEPFINTTFDGPQLDDILAVHRNYGDVNEKSNGGLGNNSFSNATPLGLIGDQQTESVGTDAVGAAVGSAQVDFVSIDDNSDLDYFSFIVSGPSEVDLLLTPKGPTYNEAPQTNPATTQTSLNTSALSDLSLQLFNTDGTSPLGFANNTAAGGSESLSGVFLPTAGTYYAAVSGADNNVQLYRLDVSLTAVPEPKTVILAFVACAMLLGAYLRQRRREVDI